MRRGIAAALLLLPVAEIAVAVAIGQWIGAGPTVIALLALSLIGVLLLRETSRRGWEDLRAAAREGTAPAQPAVESGAGHKSRGLTMFAAGLLAVPGFITAAAGLVLLLPPVRTLVRSRTRRWADAQGAWVITERFGAMRRPSGPDGPDTGNVVRGEVVED